MTGDYILLLLVRFVLPAALLLSISLRPFGLSIVYLLLFLIAPLAQVPTALTFNGFRGKYLLLVFGISALLFLVHVAWHIVLLSFPPYGSLLNENPMLERIGHNLGLVTYESVDPLKAIQFIAPELVMTGISLLVYQGAKKFTMNTPGTISKKDSKHRQYPVLTSAGKYLCLFLIMFSGILRPSVTSGIYFVVFMGAATAWALGRPLERGFAVVGRCLMAIMAVHVAILLIYQCNWLTELYPPDMSFARYFGLMKLVLLNQTQPYSFDYVTADGHATWTSLASPLILLLTYFILAIETRELFKPKPKRKSAMTGLETGGLNGSMVRSASYNRKHIFMREKWKSATVKARVAYLYINSKTLRGDTSETTPLMRNTSPTKHWTSIRSSSAIHTRGLRQDSTGSVLMPDDESQMDTSPKLMDDIIAAILDLFRVLVRSSYIATTITMMAWSIMFHSWLTFVFLMWGNCVWLCPNQRSFMLKTSPVLVVYAMMLLIAQYIYGMNLTESELPSNITNVNLHQIGLGRADGEPCIPLLIKSLFTCMFWVTLRQRIQDIRTRRQSTVITDMAAPMQLTVSTAASAIEAQREEETKSRLMRALGKCLRAACARYWIYVVAIMLFVIGITGERMTIFRIIYMFLFLAFILMFQISWYWWRRLMYMFWIIVIIYSMINLILIYIYQFDNFYEIIEKYLLINRRLQHDLGLDTYDPADLFVKLLTPTLFLISTIMQVHYFHKDFMELSDPKTRTNSVKELDTSKPSQTGGASTMKDDLPPLPSENERRLSADGDRSMTEAEEMSSMATRRSVRKTSLGQTQSYENEEHKSPFRNLLKKKFVVWRIRTLKFINKLFLFLHLHLIKIIMFSVMLLCVFNVCAIHMPLMVLISPALLLTPKKQRYCVLIMSALISLYFMAKMVYQIDYIKHSYFEVNCTDPDSGDNNTGAYVHNNAEWLGFYKTTSKKPLASLLKGYIGLIAVFTFYSLVTYRQQTIRQQKLQEKSEKVMFPDITRLNADKDLIHCIKYMINYGFYKFGVEISLMCLMGVIGSRMDMYAVIYAIWLMVLVSMRRAQQARLWMPFTLFLTIIVPLQYAIAVGFLPQLCLDFPWSGSDSQMKHVRSWLFLPYNIEPPQAIKLIFDYLLLLFASRQLFVFRIERTKGEEYEGGSNSEDIGHDWETPQFVNPVPDFLGFVGTWLDVLKRLVFLGMLWVTLAIMFLTGTNRVNLFSMGYLVGSFIFLWQGTDFYLLPKESILLWWSWLLRYNVCVVVVKTLLQIPGCIFSTVMQEHACWLVQLLGIGCVDKFAGGNIARFIKMSYVKDATCSVPQEDIGLAWDGVCFAFLILQRRFFHSYYFYRVIDESKATTVLASRGAELIESLRQKQMKIQEDQEVQILEKIKVKMERIKANQKKIQGDISKEPRHHDDDDEDDDTQQGGSEQVPLVRGDSDVSGRGFHTPDSPASPRGFHTPISEASAPPSPSHTPPPVNPPPAPLPALPPPSSHGGPPSPSSALMTSLSLDAYLEPRRISFESPPSSDLLPRAQSPEESYPVFSPPPIRRRHTVASPSLMQRTSIISQSSRAEPNSHHTWIDSDPETRWRVYTRRHEVSDRPVYRQPTSHQRAVRSGDYYMFDEFDDEEVLKLEMKEESDDEVKEMGIGKLLSTMIKTDVQNALNMRRASAPVIRSRSAKVSLGSHPHSYAHEMRPKSAGTPAQSQSEPGGEAMPSELEDYAPTPKTETCFQKMKRCLEVVWAVIGSFLVSVTRHLMRYSRDYRYVSRTLTIEKKILKEKDGFGIGLREGSQMRWEPLPETIVPHRKLSDISVPEIRILAPSMERGLDASPPPPCRERSPTPESESTPEDDTSEHESAFSLQTTDSKMMSLMEDYDDSMFKHDQSPFVHLCYALWYAILAHTDIVCYIMVFINQIQSATILSIPLPLMVFLWGTLTIPRPTKTFWVTLIAYTEVIVLIKSMFQFEILPWNQKLVPANMPFTAPRIIGIERKVNYALYDLLLLLIIFLHRFMLKSLGLWKESSPDIELREDVEYKLSPEDTEMLVEGHGQEIGEKYVKLHDITGPRHPLVDRLYHVQASIAAAMQELGASRSDPRVAHMVQQRLLRRQTLSGRRFSRPQPIDGSSASATRPNEDGDAQSDRYGDAEDLTNRDGAGPSRRNEDDDPYAVNDDQEPIIAVATTLESNYEHYPRIILLSFKRYLRPTHRFFKRMLAPGARVTADIYAYMFLCDFFNFLVVIFGFAAFGTHQGDGGVQAYLEENKVPIPFLVMLILQFALIVIDRALYLRKFMLGKILFQYALIIGVHVWMFFILPFITERTFNALLPPPLWYMMKCIYLLLSAYQIRCGYPRRIIGNFLCKSYRFLNMIFFRGFMAVPFVFELRTLMDWIWTDTSMTLMDWLKMEDIFASVFLLKCSRYVEDEFPQPRGAKKKNSVKYLLGGGVLTFVIAIIWFPLVFFAFGNTVGEPNPPTDVTVKIRIGPFLPVYQMSAQSNNIKQYTEHDYMQLSNMYARDRTAQTFLSNYMYNDIAVVSLNPNSTMKWEISPPELYRLEREAESNASLVVKFTFVITHPTNAAQNPPTIDDSREVELEATVNNERNPERETLFKMLTNKSDADTWLNVKNLFPKIVKVFNKGTAKPASQLSPINYKDPYSSYYRDVQLRLEREGTSMYWRVREKCNPSDTLTAIPLNNCNMLVMYTFNDKLFPETLNFISGSGIIGLYTTFVFLASRVIRGFFSGIYTKIMFDDLPNVDRVLQLCLDIYLVREALELSLEEDLFAKLVFLYRSPETMIKWSRPKEEPNEQRALPPSR